MNSGSKVSTLTLEPYLFIKNLSSLELYKIHSVIVFVRSR